MSEPRVHKIKTVMYVGGPFAGQHRAHQCNPSTGLTPVAHFCNKAAEAAGMRGYYALKPGTTLMEWTPRERGRLPHIIGAIHEP